jgi:hypothetical protein
MPTPQNPNDPKDEPRHDRDRVDPSRKGSGPNNPLPGEPGGPSTGGYSDADRKAAEEGQAADKAKPDDKDHSKR